ncbi:hypothetical protein HY500_02765 [Candidatus Woesearchaeota archaeon]|nr:hypothetical protein [Candidatus Woesearchaeota archaeon]
MNKIYIPKALDPDLISFDDENVYCIIKYFNLSFNELERDYYAIKEFYTWNPRNYEIIEYYSKCEEMYGKEIALCLINLFSKIRRIFTKFHHSDHEGFDEKNRLYHCVIVVSDKNVEVVKETLKIIQSNYNPPTDFDKIINITPIEKSYLFSMDTAYYLFSMNITYFYHIIDPSWFGYKIKILNKGSLIKTQNKQQLS